MLLLMFLSMWVGVGFLFTIFMRLCEKTPFAIFEYILFSLIAPVPVFVVVCFTLKCLFKKIKEIMWIKI
jgi:hypothetical protein